MKRRTLNIELFLRRELKALSYKKQMAYNFLLSSFNWKVLYIYVDNISKRESLCNI